MHRNSGTSLPRLSSGALALGVYLGQDTDKRAGNWTSCTCHGPSRERRSLGGPVTVKTCSTSRPRTLGPMVPARPDAGRKDCLFGTGTQYHRVPEMLDDRKAAILRAVVEEYIATAQPVGSSHVAHKAAVVVSPATVRNQRAAPEREGYLMQPHTSAGRIPTDKGYRHFVDTLARPGSLDPNQRHTVKEFFAHTHGELEQMLHETSTLLSHLTDYAAVIVGPSSFDSAVVRSAQLVSLTPRVALLVVVLANGAIEKRTIDLGDETGDEHIGAASAHLAAHAVGKPF